MSDIQDEAYSEAMNEITHLKIQRDQLKRLLRACAAIFDKGAPVTKDFIYDIRKAAE